MKYTIVNCSKNKCTVIIGQRSLNPGQRSGLMSEAEIRKPIVKRFYDCGLIKINPDPFEKRQIDVRSEISLHMSLKADATISEEIKVEPSGEAIEVPVAEEKTIEVVDVTVEKKRRRRKA